jgi:regulator of protease activity HflC (stomatin/prohibitin superfamily)
MMTPYLLPIILILGLIYTSIKILMEYERGVIFFLGKFQTVKGPGLILVLPGIQKMMRVNLQTVTMDVPAQDVITRDNVSVKVNAVIFFRVVDPERAILAVQDYLYSTSQIAQTTLRSVLGQSQLDELLSKREEINVELQRIIDQQTEPWGVKVSAVEVKNVDLPQEMLRAIAKQAEAERERRAKVIHAQGEFEASQKLSEAAVILSNPTALQLRYLQTLVEVGAEKNSTIIFPIPIDIISSLIQATRKS